MVHVMERSYEGGDPMAHPAVDRVLQEGPGEKSRAEQSRDTNSVEHTSIVKLPTLRAQSFHARRAASQRGGIVPPSPLGAWRLEAPRRTGARLVAAEAADVSMSMVF